MAQSKVSDFFTTKKSCSELQPSKRRKLHVVTESENVIETPVFASPPLAARTRSRKKSLFSTTTVPISTQPKNVKINTKNKSKKSSKIQDSCQRTIIDAFNADTQARDGNEASDDVATAALDDHNLSPPCSPSKKNKFSTDSAINCKRSRLAKPKDLLNVLSDLVKTPERGFDFSKCVQKETTSARKKLLLKSPTAKNNARTQEISSSTNVGSDQTNNTPGPSHKAEEKQQLRLAPSNKHTKEIDTVALKAKLMRDGKFSELQEKLAGYSKKKAQQSSPIKKYKPKLLIPETDEGSPKAPAYERFHALADPIPATLGLPFKYKLLAEMFRGVDTVVSMLHKRSEICTFSKLKSAVQQLVRKNFEEKHLGQVKTVYPSAYVFRQENGLHTLTGGAQNRHQLTVEANLETPLGEKEENVRLDKYGKPVFTASHLTDRVSTFHRKLIGIVKKYHKEFLANLDKPMSVDDNKIKRWHPQFRVDSVPDIKPSPLPQPPDYKKLTTAAEVLEHAKVGLNPRIQRALKLAAGQISPKKSSPITEEVNTNRTTSEQKRTVTKEKNNLSGVSQSLLERIRAKEAAKTEAAMLRSPEEDARLKRIERLPELSRILRSVYITQKKPALLLEDVINKLGESYKSNIGKVEAEKHVLLLVELVPDWLQIVQVKRGKFIKIDKNKDMNIINEQLLKIFKDAK